MLNLGQVTRSHLTQVQHLRVHSFNTFNCLQHNGKFSFFLFSFLTDTLCQLPRRLKESVDTAPCPCVCNLFLAPPLNLPVSQFFFSSFSLMVYLPIVPCPLPSALIPSPLCRCPSPHAMSTPPPLVSPRPLPSIVSRRCPLPSHRIDAPSPQAASTALPSASIPPCVDAPPLTPRRPPPPLTSHRPLPPLASR
jgi:hypothetical protein